MAQLASIIARMGDGQGPDLLGVCEVENRHALQALAERLNALLPERAYDIIHVDAEREQRGIDTAFITDGKRLKPRRKELFSHWVMRRTGTRDITQCTFVTAAGNELIALANHWPSRSAPAGRGPQYSAGFRATAGETLGYWHERIREVKGPDAAVLAMGDFNDDPFDASLTIHAGATREQATWRARRAPVLQPELALPDAGRGRPSWQGARSGRHAVFQRRRQCVRPDPGRARSAGGIRRCARGWKARASKPIRRWWTIESAKGRSASACPAATPRAT